MCTMMLVVVCSVCMFVNDEGVMYHHIFDIITFNRATTIVSRIKLSLDRFQFQDIEG